MKKRSIEEIEHELFYGSGIAKRETFADKVKVIFASVGFIVLFIGALLAVGYLVSVVVDKTSTHATEITNEAECRNEGYAWHSVKGCMTQDMFRENYIDR